MSNRSISCRAFLLAAVGSLLMTGFVSANQSPMRSTEPSRVLRKVSDEEIAKIEEAMPAKPTVEPSKRFKILVFWRCEGFFHGSIPVANKALQIMGTKTGAFHPVFTDDYLAFAPDHLQQYDAVCLNNTTNLQFDPAATSDRCKALMDFVKGGKAIIGIHAATDNFYQWPEGMEMMGGKFTGHPWGGGGTWGIKIDEPDHPLNKAFEGKAFKIKDEIYRTEPPLYSRSKQRVLLSLDMSDPATKAKSEKPTDADTGITWIKGWGKGRIFYCSLGHNDEIFWNKAVMQHYLDGIQFALGDYKVDTKPVASSEKGSEMEQLLEKVKTYDFGQSRLALTQLSDQIRAAYGDAGQLRNIEKALAAVLASDATFAGKQYVCRELSIIGTEQSVPALAKLLTTPKYDNMARYALERIPGEAVDAALLAAMGETGGTVKIGIVNSLGERGTARAAGPIGKLVGDSDKALAIAAISALGKIGGDDAAATLAAAKDEAEGQTRLVVLDAYLKCADQYAAKGDRAKAVAIYRELNKAGEPKLIRSAAMRGMLGAAGSRRER